MSASSPPIMYPVIGAAMAPIGSKSRNVSIMTVYVCVVQVTRTIDKHTYQDYTAWIVWSDKYCTHYHSNIVSDKIVVHFNSDSNHEHMHYARSDQASW